MGKDMRPYDRDLNDLKDLVGDVDQTPVRTCAICSATDREMTGNLVAVSQRVASEGPRVGVESGFYTICQECAPLCRKCRLPRLNRTVRDFAEAVGGRISESAACRHFRLSSLWPG